MSAKHMQAVQYNSYGGGASGLKVMKLFFYRSFLKLTNLSAQ